MNGRFQTIHDVSLEHASDIPRLSGALYNSNTDMLSSSSKHDPVRGYETALSDNPILSQLALNGRHTCCTMVIGMQPRSG